MSTSATLDVRLPIGAMFAVDGAILTLYGLVKDPPEAVARLAGNLNLWWGLVLVVFGGGMLAFGLMARAAAKSARPVTPS